MKSWCTILTLWSIGLIGVIILQEQDIRRLQEDQVRQKKLMKSLTETTLLGFREQGFKNEIYDRCGHLMAEHSDLLWLNMANGKLEKPHHGAKAGGP